jgi:hypothetical protein
MKNLKNESRSIEREFMWIEFGSRWSVDWDIEYLSIDGIERLYKEGVDELLEDEYGKEIVDEFCELKCDYERNIFSVILSDDREELYIEVNEKNEMLCKYFNEEEEGMYRIGEEVDSLFGVKSWSEIIKEYKIFENM